MDASDVHEVILACSSGCFEWLIFVEILEYYFMFPLLITNGKFYFIFMLVNGSIDVLFRYIVRVNLSRRLYPLCLGTYSQAAIIDNFTKTL